MINPPKATKAPNIERKTVLDWSVGTVTDYDARRLVDNALKSSTNMVLEQNGVVRPRPSLVEYGPQPIGEILGEIFECKVVTGTTSTFYLVTMQAINGKAYVCYCKGEDVLWTKIAAREYDATASAHFVQIGDRVLIMNGIDKLSYIDLTSWSIVAFERIDDPTSAPTAEATGLSGSGFLVYYAITANSTVGETAASEVASVVIGTSRDSWDSDSQYVELSWDAAEGATGYNVYVGTATDGEGKPTLYLLRANINPSMRIYKDDGSQAIDISRIAPEYNFTSGPKVRRGAVVNGRVWLVGDTDNPYYIF